MNFGMETELIGTLYFGVRNDGEILGQQIGDRTLREISQGIANAVKPRIIPTITKHIRVLREKGIIKRVGSKKNGHWVIEEETL